MCTITEGDFSCEPLYNEVSLDTPNVTLIFDIIKGGTLITLEQLNGTIELQLKSCDGDPLACGQLAMVDVYIPCSSVVTTQARHVP